MKARPSKLIASFAVLVWATSCREPTAPAPAILSVVVGQKQVLATRATTGGWGSFPVDVSLENRSDSPIRIFSCGPIAEREVLPGRWENVYELYCLLGAISIDLPPHSVMTRTELITLSSTNAGSSNITAGTIAGRYRMLYRYAGPQTVGQLSEARSMAFEVVE